MSPGVGVVELGVLRVRVQWARYDTSTIRTFDQCFTDGFDTLIVKAHYDLRYFGVDERN